MPRPALILALYLAGALPAAAWGSLGHRMAASAAGVPLQCDEGADFQTFRLGLFGLEKLHNVARTVGQLEQALGQLG